MADMTEAERIVALQAAAAIMAKGGSPATSAPATQKFLARWNEDRKNAAGEKEPGFEFYDNPNYAEPKAAAPPAPISGSQYGNWAPVDPANPGGEWRQVVPPQTGTPANPDEERSKALKAQVDELRRNELLRNDAAGNGFLTDEQVATEARLRREGKVSEDTLALNRAKWVEDNRRADDKAKIDAAKLPGELAKTTAETGQIVSATDLNRAQMDALKIRTEADVVRAQKAGLLDDAQAEKIRAELLKGESLTTPADQQFLARRDPSGQLITDLNPNYQGPKAPTTRGDIAQRTALLQSQMQQMKDKIMADKSIPPDQQAARFATWYDQNVAPQIGALEQQQQSVMYDEAQKATELQQKNLTAAGNAMQGLMPYRVGPGYGQAFESLVSDTANTQFPGVTNKPWNPPAGWSTFKAPNLDEHIKNLVSNQPATPGAMDIRGMLGSSQYMPGGAPPGGPPPGGPPPGPPPPGGPPAAGPADPFNSPFGAIGSNPMLAAQQAYNRQMASQQTAAATANPNNSPFGAIGPGGMPPPMPPPAVMPTATGDEPLPYSQPYNPAPFRGVIPLLPGVTPQQFQNPYQWPFGGGGGGGAGFTAGP